MSDKVTMNIDLRNVQEQVEDGVKQAQTMGRKALLTYAGMWGLAYDKAHDLWGEGAKLIDKAEKRGEDIEAEWMKQFNKVQEKPEVKRVVDYVEDQVDHVGKNAKSVVAEVEKFLAQFQPAAGNVQSAMKDVAIEVQAAITEAVVEGYDEMPAKDVVAMLPSFSKEMLVKVREYEAANKNRVTVLREIDAMLETPAEAAEEVIAA
jgi:chemotaxis regulatin CheY-phosphate phosphatase CheZ